MHTTFPAAPVPHAVAALRVCETIDQVRELQETKVDPPYAPDWVVQVVVDHGRGAAYRWQVMGLNTNFQPGGYQREFYWRVPYLSWRYDLTNARLLTDAEGRTYSVKETG